MSIRELGYLNGENFFDFLEVVLEGTTIKILLKKKTNKYIGYFKEMEFESDG